MTSRAVDLGIEVPSARGALTFQTFDIDPTARVYERSRFIEPDACLFLDSSKLPGPGAPTLKPPSSDIDPEMSTSTPIVLMKPGANDQDFWCDLLMPVAASNRIGEDSAAKVIKLSPFPPCSTVELSNLISPNSPHPPEELHHSDRSAQAQPSERSLSDIHVRLVPPVP